MMRRAGTILRMLKISAVVGSTAALLLTTLSSAAQASAVTFQVTGGVGQNICTSNGTASMSFPTNEVFSTTVTESYSLTVPGYGTVAGNTFNRTPASFSSFTIFPGAYSVAPNTSITFTNTIYNGPNSSGGIALVVTATFDCTTGNLTGTSAGNGTGGTGPQVPSGFAMKLIICTTPVYIAPGSTQTAGSAQVLAGQRWYVSLVPVKDQKGTLWTELFDGGYSDGFIPTRCLNLGFNYVYGVN